MNHRYPKVPVEALERFVKIVRRLRKECPWDRVQTHQSIRHSLIEEAYEVVETLDQNNIGELKNELGDLLLHVVMHATIAEQAKEFTFEDLIQSITDKLVRRHPHVFGTLNVRNAEQVKHNWEKLKMKEGRTSILDGVPRGMPSLQRATRMQERTGKVGFEWDNIDDVWKKVIEEADELRVAVKKKRKKQQEEELGDYLFALVNYARYLNIDPEAALRGTVRKFEWRFRYIEDQLRLRGKDPHNSTLKEMDALWNKAKKIRKRSSP
ncbi:MAG: nucleoside triphosphate pyrophosphohydrolase [Bacteroidota bacterium]